MPVGAWGLRHTNDTGRNDVFALLSISRATTCECVGFKMAQKYRIIKKEFLAWACARDSHLSNGTIRSIAR